MKKIFKNLKERFTNYRTIVSITAFTFISSFTFAADPDVMGFGQELVNAVNKAIAPVLILIGIMLVIFNLISQAINEQSAEGKLMQGLTGKHAFTGYYLIGLTSILVPIINLAFNYFGG